MTQIMTHFTRHYIDILQEMLLSSMLFCGKFIKVYVCQKLLKYSLVWQTYGKNKTVQFFASQCIYYDWLELYYESEIVTLNLNWWTFGMIFAIWNFHALSIHDKITCKCTFFTYILEDNRMFRQLSPIYLDATCRFFRMFSLVLALCSI